ncbi:tRNA nucleotidyltransferase [Labilithrix luteola]|uniref:tRNA nucleotidyltransferase n=1 Tax=Labilithrix luteola TaxID=1391654 RepID=A0A0K1QDM7_9BACT|nr:HD domain-containing protein [Labilithrix luteola]AKV03752.1 tRNA nucleotidyltransferase [Labilithrix luteola]
MSLQTRQFDLAHVPQDVFGICDKLAAAGKRAWIVGGCVRDSLLGKAVADWDVATDALPNELMKIFPRAIPTGLQHGTVTLVVRGHHYEITTLRGETTYSDGRRPDAVHFVDDIAADLARRDFTINAIAVDPRTGTVIDPFGGQTDLDAKIVRAVGIARERFSEDGLRVLRAARFSATLEFELDPDTFAAIEPTLDTYRKVSAERVRDEWVKTMKAKKPSRAFEVMRKSGILAVTCPELLEGVDVEQNKWHSLDVWNHGMACMDACVGDPILRISALLHDVGKPRTRAFSEKTQDYTFYDHDKVGAEIAFPIANRLRFSNDERDRIVSLVRNHLFHYDNWSDAAVRRWIKRVGKERVEDLYALNEADLRGKGPIFKETDLAALQLLRGHVEKVLAEGAALSTRDLAVDGNDLMKELGLERGRIIGDTLNALLEIVIGDPAANERGVLLQQAREIVQKLRS